MFFSIARILTMLLSLIPCIFSIEAMKNNNNYNTPQKRTFIQFELENSDDEKMSDNDFYKIERKKFKNEACNNHFLNLKQVAQGTIKLVEYKKQVISYIEESITEQDPETGNTLLHMALFYNNQRLIELIIKWTLQDSFENLLSIRNKSSHTPFHVAIIKNNFEFLKLSLQGWIHKSQPILEELYSFACRFRREGLMIDLITDEISHSNHVSTHLNLLQQREYESGMKFEVQRHFLPSKIAIQGKQDISKYFKNNENHINFLLSNHSDASYAFINDCQNNLNDIAWFSQFDYSLPYLIMLRTLPEKMRDQISNFSEQFLTQNDATKKAEIMKDYLNCEENFMAIVEHYPYFTYSLLCLSVTHQLYDMIPYIVKKFHQTLPPFINTEGFLYDCMNFANIPIECFKTLLSLNPNINIPSGDDNETLLFTAIRLRNAAYINALLQYNPDIKAETSNSETALGAAAWTLLNENNPNSNLKTSCENVLKHALKYMSAEKLIAFIREEFESYESENIDEQVAQLRTIIQSFDFQV